MDTRNPDVVDGIHLVAHHFRRDTGLFRDGDVARSRADDGDRRLAQRLAIAPDPHRARTGKEFGLGVQFLHRFEHRCVGASDQQIGRPLQERRRNGPDLFDGLAAPQNDLGHAVPQLAVMVNLREAEVFVGEIPEFLDRAVDIAIPVTDTLQEGAQAFVVHGWLSGGAYAPISRTGSGPLPGGVSMTCTTWRFDTETIQI